MEKKEGRKEERRERKEGMKGRAKESFIGEELISPWQPTSATPLPIVAHPLRLSLNLA